MDIEDNKYDLRTIHEYNKDMTPLFGQFDAYMVKFNITFGFTKFYLEAIRFFFSKTVI